MNAIMSADEFLAWEADQPDRHEWLGGRVVDKDGSADDHNLINGNIAIALQHHLAGRPCRTFLIAMMLETTGTPGFFYPDVVVTCSATDRSSPLIVREPTLIIEVLSPSTAAYDRGEKFAHYRSIASLKEVAFIDIHSRRTDVYRRGADGLWVLHPFDAGDAVSLASVDLTMAAAAMFAEVDD